MEYKNLNPGESSPFKCMIRARPNMDSAGIQFEAGGVHIGARDKKGK